MALHLDNIPSGLKQCPQWILWKWAERDGKKTKIPINIHGIPASTSDPSTWSTFENVQAAGIVCSGIGFVFTRSCNITGIDLDHCRDPATGIIDPWALKILSQMNSYSEISPSGEGVHVIINGSLPIGIDGKKKTFRGEGFRLNAAIEIYSAGRYFTVTGEKLDNYPLIVEDRQSELLSFFSKYFENPKHMDADECSTDDLGLPDEQVLKNMFGSRNGSDIEALYNGDTSKYNGDDSAADLALCNHLAYWSRKDERQIDRIFRRSKLFRPKWDEMHGSQTYGEITINKAIQSTTEFYEPLVEESAPEINDIEYPRLEIKLEPDNAIIYYTEYGKTTCDAYPEYHYAMALNLVSTATNRNLVLKLSQGDVFPNVWSFCLGRSTISRKSAAASKGDKFAAELFPQRALPQSYSPEGLIEALSEMPQAYLIKDESGAMLAAMEKSYMMEMRDLYCILYDNQSYSRKLRSGQRKEVREFNIKDPFVNMWCATTPENFRAYTCTLDLTSGWLLRFLYFYPNYKKEWMAFKPASEKDYGLYSEALSRISKIKGLFYDRDELLEIFLSSSALTYYQEWQRTREMEMQAGSFDAIELALWGRLAYYALKLSMLFTVSRADYSEGMDVSQEHIIEACRQVDDYFLPIGRIVAEEVAREEAKNIQNMILGILSRCGGKILRRDLLRKLHLKIKDVDEAIAALVESEEIELRGKWIILRMQNAGTKSRKPVDIPTGFAESHESQPSQNNNCPTDSDDIGGIYVTGGTEATSATFATSVEETIHIDPEIKISSSGSIDPEPETESFDRFKPESGSLGYKPSQSVFDYVAKVPLKTEALD